MGPMLAMRAFRWIWVLVLLAGLVPPPGHAQPYAPKPPTTEEDRAAEREAAWKAAVAAATRGPASIPLRNEATLALPAGMVFIPQAEATRLSRAVGNQPGAALAGIVTTLSDKDDWFVYVSWLADGYVRDDEAKDLDADTVLQGLRDGVDEGNKDRQARGFPELEVVGWNQPPQYDSAAHQLSWSLALKEKGAADGDPVVNYNTRALGRDGYFSVNLVTNQASFAQDRGVATTLLSGLAYDGGKRYADFDSSTDHVAEYGLMALIGVAAAKKLGMLALGAAFLLKFAKLGILAVGGGLVAVRRFFRRKPSA